MSTGFNKILLWGLSVLMVLTEGAYGSQRPPEDSSDSDRQPDVASVRVLVRPASTLAMPEVRPRRVTSAPNRPNSPLMHSFEDDVADSSDEEEMIRDTDSSRVRPRALAWGGAAAAARPPRPHKPPPPARPHSPDPDFVEEIGSSSSARTIFLDDEPRAGHSQISRQSSGVMTYPFQSSRQSSAASSALPSPPIPLRDRDSLLPPPPRPPAARSIVAGEREPMVKRPSENSAFSDTTWGIALSEERPASMEGAVSLSGAELRRLREADLRRIMGEEEVRKFMEEEEVEEQLQRMKAHQVLPTMFSPLQGTPPSTSSVVFFHDVDSGLERQLSEKLHFFSRGVRVRRPSEESSPYPQNSAAASSSGIGSEDQAHQNASLPSPRTLQARRQARAQQASRGGGDGPDRSSPYSYRSRGERTGHAVRGGSPVTFE